MMVGFTIRWGLKGALWSYESYKIPTEWIHGTGKISGNLKSIGTSIIKRDTEPKMNIFSLEIQVLWCFSCPETSRNHLSSPGWFNRRAPRMFFALHPDRAQYAERANLLEHPERIKIVTGRHWTYAANKAFR